jgi:hypothetical protein
MFRVVQSLGRAWSFTWYYVFGDYLMPRQTQIGILDFHGGLGMSVIFVSTLVLVYSRVYPG